MVAQMNNRKRGILDSIPAELDCFSCFGMFLPMNIAVVSHAMNPCLVDAVPMKNLLTFVLLPCSILSGF